jgi:hypothetical protein
MIDKKFVAIMLAMGLMVSVGQAVSPRLSSQVERTAGFVIGGDEQQTIQPMIETTSIQGGSGASIENNGNLDANLLQPLPDDVNPGIHYLIDSYQIIQNYKSLDISIPERPIIYCYSKGQLIAKLDFVNKAEDEGFAPVTAEYKDGIITLSFTSKSFENIVNTLREEDLVGIGYSADLAFGKSPEGSTEIGYLIIGPSQIG